MTELIQRSAVDMVQAMHRREISAVEALEASMSRIDAVDGEINALPIRCFDRAMDRARAQDNSKDPPEGLAGLPVAIKDYNDLGGVRTTYGSPIFADNVPARSDATVARLEAHGANPVAKSNVPEWAGGHTFNPVNGLTRNPWNLERSAGGSSGGSAAALASGQIWLATGNDLGGSLRTPAAFNGVVGLRPSPGLVPRGARLQPFDTLWVEGPMARSVEDLALMLDAGKGFDAEDPLSFDHPGSFLEAAQSPAPPRRVGFSTDLGAVPMAREVAAVARQAMDNLAAAGLEVVGKSPDFTGAFDTFQTLRAALLGAMMGPLLAEHRDRINEDIIGNIELGFAITPEQLFEAEQIRRALYHRMVAFFGDHDLLVCPAASITAFPVDQRYVTEIDGRPCETYIDWFAITFILTLTGCPVLSLPCGLSPEGLPVGLQIVGKPRGEAALLSAARWMETALGSDSMTPIDPKD